MAWSFHKRIKIIPGVHLNFSKRGISTTIGVKGASINLGPSGTYLNTSIPGLGINNRQKISSPKPARHPDPLLPAVPQLLHHEHEVYGNIFSADIHEITSQDMQGIKEAILLAKTQKLSLRQDLLQINKVLAKSKLKLTFSYVFLYGFFKKEIPCNIKVDIGKQEDAISQIKYQIEHCQIDLQIDFEPEIQQKYEAMAKSFMAMASSQYIWDVTSAHYQDRVAARSSASTLVNKRTVKFGLKTLSAIKSEFQALYFHNANGADLYFYPGFIIMFSSPEKFAVVGFNEIQLSQSYVRFIETGIVPKDSKVIDSTWAKVNKNGTPDKRFKGNYQIPIVKYGEICLTTASGLNEEYHFSNYESTESFNTTFKDYQRTIDSLKAIEV